MYKHFILTRFNLKFNGIPGLEKYNLPEQTEEWLNRRFFLFEKYCFPSIMNQVNKDFIWFVMFDSNTPERFFQKIKNYELMFPLFKPLFLDKGDSDSIKKTFNEVIALYLSNDDHYVITSRIDSDDAFHKDMVLEVQKLFNRQDNIFLSFAYGLQYDIERKVLARMHYENNHFISRIEKISNGIETVITFDHTNLNKVADVVYINNKQKPLWLEIIHGGNLINSLYPSSTPLFSSKITRSFNCEEKISLVNTLLMLYKYLKLNALILRSNMLRRMGIYNFLKGLVKKQ
jgi:hypothetical protein